MLMEIPEDAAKCINSGEATDFPNRTICPIRWTGVRLTTEPSISTATVFPSFLRYAPSVVTYSVLRRRFTRYSLRYRRTIYALCKPIMTSIVRHFGATQILHRTCITTGRFVNGFGQYSGKEACSRICSDCCSQCA